MSNFEMGEIPFDSVTGSPAITSKSDYRMRLSDPGWTGLTWHLEAGDLSLVFDLATTPIGGVWFDQTDVDSLRLLGDYATWRLNGEPVDRETALLLLREFFAAQAGI